MKQKKGFKNVSKSLTSHILTLVSQLHIMSFSGQISVEGLPASRYLQRAHISFLTTQMYRIRQKCNFFTQFFVAVRKPCFDTFNTLGQVRLGQVRFGEVRVVCSQIFHISNSFTSCFHLPKQNLVKKTIPCGLPSSYYIDISGSYCQLCTVLGCTLYVWLQILIFVTS